MKEILEKLMRHFGDDAYSLEEKSKVPQPTTQRFLSGKHGDPRASTVKKWADAYGISESQLRGDISIEFLEDESTSLTKSVKKLDYTIDQFHEVNGSMGGGVTLRDQPGQITGWKVTAEWANKNIPSNSGLKNVCIVTGFGDSMRGMFNSGDPLIVDTGVKSVDFDAVYFFRIGNEGFIKTLQRIPGDGIRVISENKKYESWTINEGMDFEVFGRVLKVWRSEDF